MKRAVKTQRAGKGWKFELGMSVGINSWGMVPRQSNALSFFETPLRLFEAFLVRFPRLLHVKCRISTQIRAVPLYLSHPSVASLSSRSANPDFISLLYSKTVRKSPVLRECLDNDTLFI